MYKRQVYLNEYAGTKIKYEGEDLVIVRQSDILAVIELSLIHIFV